MLKLVGCFAIVAFVCVGATAQVASESVVNTAEAEQWRADLRFMAEAMPRYHKNLFHTMTREQFTSAIENLDRRIPTLARPQIIVELARIVAMVGDGHTNIAPTRDPKIGFHTLPIKLYFFDDGLFVRAATKEHADLVGASVVKIGEVPIAKAYDSVKQLIGRDNEMDLKFFAPFLMTMPEILNALGLTPQPDEVSFVVEKNGRTQTVKLSSVGPVQMMPADTDLSWLPQAGWVDARDTATEPAPLWLRDPQNKFWFQFLPETRTVYAQVNQIGNKDDESMDSFTKRLLAFIDANPVERLVLDLRLNRGGNGEFNRPILRALIKANKIDQKGKLFVLIGRSTWSAAQFLVNDLEDYTEAVFVGEPTGGKRNSFGDSHRITLPNSGITVRVSTLWWQEDERDRRQWKAPELAADLSFNDYRNNIDPALKLAMSYVPGKSLTESLNEVINNPTLVAERFKEWRAASINKYANGEAQVNRLGYELLAKKQFDQALALFKLNTSQYPTSSNSFDSLGDGYLARGDRDAAAKSYERALELDPLNASARDSLERMRNPKP